MRLLTGTKCSWWEWPSIDYPTQVGVVRVQQWGCCGKMSDEIKTRIIMSWLLRLSIHLGWILGQAWASPTLAWLHLWKLCACMHVWFRPYTVNFKWVHLNRDQTSSVSMRYAYVQPTVTSVKGYCHHGLCAMTLSQQCLPPTMINHLTSVWLCCGM